MDIDERRCEAINSGKNPIPEEAELDELIKEHPPWIRRIAWFEPVLLLYFTNIYAIHDCNNQVADVAYRYEIANIWGQ